ncbi:MAG TPA: N-acetylmuramoyl-L-alanine amidase [Thermoanaerobaculaceae bacterium]|nr:N-acetylmuramoyl-L-alanine amidase [Thermoanaerobaculaceae bacterium]HRS14651.1 N-acetylmuramoyl-L-alanine amidase [Thermoanaerobaculaceae bacterium]
MRSRSGSARAIVRLALVLAAAPLLAAPGLAVPVTTPQGPVEVAVRGDLIDILALLRLTGAEVGYAPAAGSFTATLGDFEVQFTPGGSLAVADGRLLTLPGPLRQIGDSVFGSFGTASALLTPLGWSLAGSPAAPVLDRTVSRERLILTVVRAEGGVMVVVGGTTRRPRVSTAAGAVTLQFTVPIELGAPLPHAEELRGAEVAGDAITLRLAPDQEVASTYTLEDPPRFVIRLQKVQPVTGVVQQPHGPVVVIDPGHGGEDLGAQSASGAAEKDIVLAVARATAARLQAAGITARLTRERDEAIGLGERTAMANRLQAVAFVSIHVNASPARSARGAETYFMSANASDTQAAQSAARENVGASEDAVQLILWDLAYVANLNASARLARTIQERLNALQDIKDRGVRQAPFVVLTGATMPAALVELGFISNPEEAVRLQTAETQDQLAAALAEAIAEFVRTPGADAAATPAGTP